MNSTALSELEKYNIQLQQVEAALIAEPDSEDLLKLKEDLNEIIVLQAELVANATPGSDTPSPTQGQSYPGFAEKSQWKVGDRCMAPTKNGQRHIAVIDGISQDKVAITFASNGKKDMVRLTDLTVAPVEEKKKYIFQTTKTQSGPKKEWQMERERRKLRAQKKEQRRKNLDEQKETEKNKWKNFNSKAEAKSMKGIKRIAASGSSADGGRSAPNRSNMTVVSSRKDYQSFGATLRGNMESLF